MRPRSTFAALAAILFVLAALPAPVTAQTANAPAQANLPADPWPRDVSIANAAVLIYQPQVNRWSDNRIDFRAALAIKPTGAQNETFGVAFATARTQVDKVARTVLFENLSVTKVDFPTLPDRGAQYAADLQKRLASDMRTISLDRLESSLALVGVKPSSVAVQNDPPQVIVSHSPAILVPIDGVPVMKPVPQSSRFRRVVNTRALILQGGFGDRYYLHVHGGWLQADSLAGPWTQEFMRPLLQSGKSGAVDLLDGPPNAKPKPTLADGIPAIYVSQAPAELIVFKGQPDFVPIQGTGLLWASNTTSDVLVDTADNRYYVLLAGRWFRGPGLSGPWSFVASDALPADFAKIPPHSLAGAVLPTVAGTPQAREALIANSIPQTATVPLRNGPKFTPNFDGAPQYAPVPGTSLSYVTNASVPIIQVTPASYYAVEAGVWFTAPGVTGPWTVATSVPTALYAIPPSSPIYYVTYVRIYETTPQYVYVGYTPGYLGTVVSPSGTIVYGTGYVYSPWIGSVWYATPYTYGVAAVPVYNPYVGYTFGFAMGLATAAWMEPYWGGAYYHPAYWGAYGCCATASANVYGHWGSTTYSGTRSWYAGGGVAGTTFSGNYSNARTGTTGDINAGRQYNAWTGNATRGYDRTMNGAAGGSGQVARASNYNVYTGQRSTGSAPPPAAAPTTAPAPRPRAPRATRTSAAGRRRTRRPARRTPGGPPRSATTRSRTSTATSTTTTAAAGSSTPRAAGRAPAATRRGPIASRRRAAPARTSSATSAAATGSAAAGTAGPTAQAADSAAATASAAADSAAAASAAADPEGGSAGDARTAPAPRA
jgi:hypothetical protein